MMPAGYLTLVLHAHLPYVRHPEHAYSLEEKWLFEAITESYIPLLWGFERLADEGIPYRVTVSISPPLLTMWRDAFLQQRYVAYLEKLIELAEKEIYRTRGTTFEPAACMYYQRFKQVHETFCRRYRYDLVKAFAALQDAGHLEIITTAATHGYLPLMMRSEAIRAQIAVGVTEYQDHFGRRPQGMWLPECGYVPGVDHFLKEYGLRYFFTDTHGVLFASHRPRYGVFAPIYCRSGVAAFGRDAESSKQVWSAQEGYPGDFDYREYYRDIGFDLDYEYIRPYIHPDGIRVHTGIKYYRVTGKTQHKEPYVPAWAYAKADIHAGNFMFNREQQIGYLKRFMDRPPLIVAPYDAELFGHWWFEGPIWLELLIRKVNACKKIELVTPTDYLNRHPCNQVATPCASSWGDKGYHEVWLCQANEWIYRHLHWAQDRMVELAAQYPDANGILKRALKQATRELLLAQASDWAFIMATGTMVQYALRRTKLHLLNFKGLWHQIRENRLEPPWLNSLEERHRIFPNIEPGIYAPQN